MLANLGSLIKAYRIKKGITSAQLAEAIGVSQGSISQFETGRRKPSEELLRKIAREIDMPENIPDDLDLPLEELLKRDMVNTDLKLRVGFTELSVSLTTKIPDDIDFKSFSPEDREMVNRAYSLHSPIIMRTVSNFLIENTGHLTKLIIQNVNKELEKQKQILNIDNDLES